MVGTVKYDNRIYYFIIKGNKMTTVNSVGVGLSGQSGTGAFAGTTSPTFVTPALGTPSSGNLSNCTGLQGEVAWAANSNTSNSAAVGNGYILTAASPTTVTLPTTFAVGALIAIVGEGSSWTCALGASTNIKAFGNTYTTSFASANNTDTLWLVATVANTTWAVLSMSTTGFTAS